MWLAEFHGLDELEFRRSVSRSRVLAGPVHSGAVPLVMWPCGSLAYLGTCCLPVLQVFLCCSAEERNRRHAVVARRRESLDIKLEPCCVVPVCSTGSNASEDLRPSKTIKALLCICSKKNRGLFLHADFQARDLKVSGFQPSTTLSRAGGTAADLTGATCRQSRCGLGPGTICNLQPRSSHNFHVCIKTQMSVLFWVATPTRPYW